MTWTIANEVGNKAAFAGTEGAVIPAPITHQWIGELNISKTADLNLTEEATGGYDRYTTVKLEDATHSGTFGTALSYQSAAIHAQYAIKQGAAGVLASGATGAYAHVKAPSFNMDDVASATVVYGVDGLAWQSTGVRHDEWTLTVDADDSAGLWQFSSNLFVSSKDDLPPVIDGVATGGTDTTLTMTGAAWTVDQLKGRYVFNDFGSHIGNVRLIVSNTTDTITVDEAFNPVPTAGDRFRVEANLPTVPAIEEEKILTAGTRFYLDEAGSIGTTQITDRVISFNMTQRSNRVSKKFLENTATNPSRRSGRGARIIDGQIVFEYDRRDEFWAWLSRAQRALRITQSGGEIDNGVESSITLDIPRIAFSTISEDSRENNMTITVPFTAFLPTTGDIYTWTVVNDLAVLP